MPASPAVTFLAPQVPVANMATVVLASTQWTAPTLHLFTNNVSITKATVVGDLTEATYTGYAAGVVAAWGAKQYNPDGSITVATTTLFEFTGPATADGPVVYGWYLLGGGAGTPLLAAARFTDPVPLTDNHTILDVIPAATFRG